MSKCSELDPLFGSYADGGVAPDDCASIEAHLERCPPCRDRVAVQQRVRGVMAARRATLRAGAPPQLRARCAEHARASKPRPAAWDFIASRRWVPLSLAATLLLAVAGAFFFGVNDNVEALAAQATLDHVSCFQLAPERLKHADAATAVHDWAERQGWAIEIPSSSPDSDLELLGVRRCTMSNGGVAHVLYKWHGQPFSVFVVPHAVGRLKGQQEFVEKFGHEAIVWSEGDRTYVVLARARPAELTPVIGYVRAHTH